MIDFLLGVPGKLSTVLTRLSAARASYLDNLSAGAVAQAATAVSNADLTSGRIAKLDNLDITISTLNGYVNSPALLPRSIVGGALARVKTATGTAVDLTTSGVFTNLGYEGAAAAVAVADTFVTVCDISGSGLLTNVISPTHSAAFTPTIKITVDDVIYTIAPSSTASATDRLIIGAVLSTAGFAASAATTTSHIQMPGSFIDAGFNSARVGGIHRPGGSQLIMTPHQVLSYGFPAMRFRSNLKVEVKTSLLHATVDPNRYGAALYVLD